MPQESSHYESEQRKRLTLLWMQAQPIVAAYIGSAVRDRQHAEDVLQDTALTVAESFDQYNDERPFLPWAMGVARNKLLHYFRRHGKDRMVFDAELLEQIGTRLEDQGQAYRDRQSALERCMQQLADSAREMLRLRYIGEMGYEQIAEAVGRTTAAVANNLYRSRKALADCIKRRSSSTAGGGA